jgi:hypothetical protein
MMRAMLYEAAHIMLVRSTKWSWLKAWAMTIASSTERWKDVPRGTMDEVRSYVRLVCRSSDGKADQKIVPPRPRIP